MAQVLVLTRQDGTTETAHIGSPYLAVLFEDAHKHTAEGAADNGWMAFYDIEGRAPKDHAELLEWLKQFIATDITDLVVPTAVPTNGTVEQASSSQT